MRKSVFFVAFLVVLLYSNWSTAQIITIVDKDTRTPIEMAKLISPEPAVSAHTNSKGEIDISLFSGAEIIEVRAYGYEKYTSSYAVLQKRTDPLALSSTYIRMDEMIVAANRYEQNSSDIPSKVVSLNKREITFRNPQTTADLLGSTGRVFIQKSQQGGGSPMIRGFATNRLLYVVDGVRMNTAIFRGGNIQNVISLDPKATEFAEVFFGPGSVNYGSDAIGGVMSFNTLTPKLSYSDETLTNGSASMRYSSVNTEKSFHLDVNVGWKKWAVLSSISHNNYGDMQMGTFGPDEYFREQYVVRQNSQDVVVENPNPKIQNPSAFQQMNLMQKVRFQPSPYWNFEYAFHYSETSPYGRYDRHLRMKDSLPKYAEWNYGPQIWMMNNLAITHSKKNAFYDRMSLRVALQNFEESRISRVFQSNTRETQVEKVGAYSLNVDFIKSFSRAHHINYGAEIVYNKVSSIGMYEDISSGASGLGPSRYPNSDWSNYAVFLSDNYKFNQQFTLQTGVRYTHYAIASQFDTTFYPFPYSKATLSDGALTGSMGLVYKPTKKWIFSLNASTGFRAPNVDDIGKVFYSEPGSVVIPNPNLEAEYAYNAEIGIVRSFADVLKVDVSTYYTLLDNAMVRRDFQLNGQDSINYSGELSKVQAIQNASQATVYGVQAGFELALPSGLEFSSRINYQKGEEELENGENSPTRHAAPLFGETKLGYHKEKVKLEINAVYSDGYSYDELPISEQGKNEIYAIDRNGNPYSPGWYTLNFKVLYKVKSFLSLSGGVENITDQLYKTYSSGLVAPGRNFVLAVTVRL